MKKVDNFKSYFDLIDEKTPFSLTRKYVYTLIELAKHQEEEIEDLESELRKMQD